MPRAKEATRTLVFVFLALLLSGLALLIGALLGSIADELQFSGDAAYRHVVDQVNFGPRVVGSEAHAETVEYIKTGLEGSGWRVEVQRAEYRGTPITNIVGRAGSGPVLILGAHFDTRRLADQDPLDPTQPVPGANDGASGVAVLLELARVLDRRGLEREVWLVFFDAEDNGGLDGWDWIVGSREFARSLTVKPSAAVVVDMIGDAHQDIYMDRNSDPALSAEIWGVAASLGYGQAFIPEFKYSMLDDHTPFAELGIPAVDIIDFDYPGLPGLNYWHTTQDTVDKVSPESLERVGRTLEYWIERSGP